MTAGGSVEIRRVQATEWAQYREVRLEALSTDPLAFGSTLEREARYPPERWQARMARDAGARDAAAWVVVVDGSFVGLVSAGRVEGEWHLFEMWLRPALRGKGLGARLLDRILAWIGTAEPGASVHLDVNPDQGAAYRLYESRGFEPDGTQAPLPHSPGHLTVGMVRATRAH